jgi:hypothetical protein
MRAQNIVAQLIALIGSIACPIANAADVQYEFQASLTDGPLQGTSFVGTFSFDAGGITGVGMEYLTLTSLDFNLLGTTFTRADIKQGGQAILDNGKLDYFTAAFFPPPPLASPVQDIAFGFGGPGIIGYVKVINGVQVFGQGRYAFSAGAVPEVSTLGLMSVGLLIGLWRGGRQVNSNSSAPWKSWPKQAGRPST